MLKIAAGLLAELDRRGWSKNRLSLELGMRDRASIARMTNPATEPKEINLALLERLCDVLHKTPNDILLRVPVRQKRGRVPRDLCDTHAGRQWGDSVMASGMWCPECRAERAAGKTAA